MSPGDGDLIDTHSQSQGNVENFGIETPSFNALADEDSLRRLPAKCLETTLRVGQVKIHDQPREPVEAAPEEAAIQGLAKGLTRSVQPSRPNGHVGTIGD